MDPDFLAWGLMIATESTMTETSTPILAEDMEVCKSTKNLEVYCKVKAK